jgi:hypothetical protein
LIIRPECYFWSLNPSVCRVNAASKTPAVLASPSLCLHLGHGPCPSLRFMLELFALAIMCGKFFLTIATMRQWAPLGRLEPCGSNFDQACFNSLSINQPKIVRHDHLYPYCRR